MECSRRDSCITPTIKHLQVYGSHQAIVADPTTPSGTQFPESRSKRSGGGDRGIILCIQVLQTNSGNKTSVTDPTFPCGTQNAERRREQSRPLLRYLKVLLQRGTREAVTKEPQCIRNSDVLFQRAQSCTKMSVVIVVLRCILFHSTT